MVSHKSQKSQKSHKLHKLHKKVKKKKTDMYQLYLNMHEEKRRNESHIMNRKDENNVRRIQGDQGEDKNAEDSIRLEKEVKKKLAEQTNLLSIKGIDRVDIKQKKGKHSVICIHYIKNMCMKNLFCNYLHQLIYSRIPTCKNYLKYNYCPDKIRGSCMFRHTLENAPTNIPVDSKDEYLEDALKFLYEKNICVNYLLGFCHLGINCRRTHKMKSRKHSYAIKILPKFYLDNILVNKELYTHLYNNPQKIQSDLSKLKETLLIFSGEPGHEQLLSAKGEGNEESEQQKKDLVEGSRKEKERECDSDPNMTRDYKNGKFRSYPFGSQFTKSGKSRSGTEQEINKGVSKNNERNINDTYYNRNKGYLEKNKHKNSNNLEHITGDNNDQEESTEINPNECAIPNVYDLNNNIIPNDRFKVFVIKCNQISHLYLSILYGVWATGKNNTRKFVNLLKENYTIIFLFSVNESGGFQGYAKMLTLPIRNLFDNLWGAITSRLGGNFRVQWIKTAKIDFDVFKNMTNSYNDNLPLKKSRDGTELPLHLASIICKKIHALQGDDFLSGTIYEYKRRINHKVYFSNLHKIKMLNTCTYWDRQIFYLNQQSDCKEITYVDGSEQTIV